MRTGTQSDFETPQFETSYDWKNNYSLNNTQLDTHESEKLIHIDEPLSLQIKSINRV